MELHAIKILGLERLASCLFLFQPYILLPELSKLSVLLLRKASELFKLLKLLDGIFDLLILDTDSLLENSILCHEADNELLLFSNDFSLALVYFG